MIFDTDDLYPGHDRLDLLQQLKDANPLFRMTTFAIPALCPDEYVDGLPEWIEVVPHGWRHGDPPTDGGECRNWDRTDMGLVIAWIEEGATPRWQRGFKAPGWIISDGCYEALDEAGWWVADQSYNDQRRPESLAVHREGDGDHVHTHVQNVCGNGLEETFPQLLERVRSAESFDLISEVVCTAVAA